MKSNFAVLAVFFGSVGWGLTWIPLKYITNHGMHSTHLIIFAFAAGSLALFPWLIREYQHWKTHVRLLLLIALIGGMSNACFQTAMANGNVVRVMILFYMLPIWSVLGGRIFLKESIDLARLIAVALCLGGGGLVLDVFNISWDGIHWLDIMALLSGLLLASTNILYRISPHVSVISKTLFMFIGCFLLMGASLFLYPVTSQLPDSRVIGLAIIYGGFGLTLITLGTQWGVTHIEAGRASVIIVTELLVAVLSSAIILSLPLQMPEIIGGCMVLIAAFIEGFRKPKPLKIKATG